MLRSGSPASGCLLAFSSAKASMLEVKEMAIAQTYSNFVRTKPPKNTLVMVSLGLIAAVVIAALYFIVERPGYRQGLY